MQDSALLEALVQYDFEYELLLHDDSAATDANPRPPPPPPAEPAAEEATEIPIDPQLVAEVITGLDLLEAIMSQPDTTDTPASITTSIDTTNSTSTISMPPPPTDRTFSQENEAMDFINDFTGEHGYALTTKNSKLGGKDGPIQY
ncbi:hypothetical protein BDV12DRAFT_175075 [Aspergillus spectabilis]